MFHGFFRFLPLALLPLVPAGAAVAYQPPVAEVVGRALQLESQVSRAIIHLSTTVYDPFAAPADEAPQPAEAGGEEEVPPLEGEWVPVESPERGFRQVVYWVRGKFLAVETFSDDGRLLHFLLDEFYRPISKNLSETRQFSDWDVLPPFLPFAGMDAEGWLQGLAAWGVYPARVDLVRKTKAGILYRLVDTDVNWALVDRQNFRPVRIQTTAGEGEEALTLTIEFSDFTIFGGFPRERQNIAFPRTVNFLVNGRLAKQTRVGKFEANPSLAVFPITRLRRKARELAPPAAASLSGEVAR